MQYIDFPSTHHQVTECMEALADKNVAASISNMMQ